MPILKKTANVCPHCSKEFYKYQRYCSRSCASQANWILHRDTMVTACRTTVAIASQASYPITRGSNGFGKSARGNGGNHPSAQCYKVYSPDGHVYEMKNLREWCRNNEELFRPDLRPTSKSILYKRVDFGLRGVACGLIGSWNGWTAELLKDQNGSKNLP